MAPERMFVLDEIALEVVRAVDGETRIGDMADRFAVRFGAPRDEVLTDILEMLQDFADKRLIVA